MPEKEHENLEEEFEFGPIPPEYVVGQPEVIENPTADALEDQEELDRKEAEELKKKLESGKAFGEAVVAHLRPKKIQEEIEITDIQIEYLQKKIQENENLPDSAISNGLRYLRFIVMKEFDALKGMSSITRYESPKDIVQNATMKLKALKYKRSELEHELAQLQQEGKESFGSAQDKQESSTQITKKPRTKKNTSEFKE